MQVPRYIERTSEGQDEITIQQFSQMEDVLGSHNRSGEQIEIWDAAYGPIGDDGYPKPLWDKQTGKIDHSVALYMRDHGYDLSYNLRTNWATLGPKLQGKLHVIGAGWDTFYLDPAVGLLQDFLATVPHGGYVEFHPGDHGSVITPILRQRIRREMADQLAREGGPAR